MTLRSPPRARRAYATLALIAVNGAVFLGEEVLGPRLIGRFGQARLEVWQGEYWRLLTGTFLHADPGHLFLNMLALALLGRDLERLLGWWRFLAIYLVSGLAGSLAFQAASDADLAVGASGSVYGIFGAFLLLAKSGRTGEGDLVPGWRFWCWLALIAAGDQAFAVLVSSAAGWSNIAVSAHAGGLLAGCALGYLLLLRPQEARSRPWFRRRALVAAGLACALAGATLYGCFFTLHDPAWQGLARARSLERQIEGREFAAAVESWRSLHGLAEESKRWIGYRLYHNVAAAGDGKLARRLLEELVRSAEAEVQSLKTEGKVTASLLNEAAWYKALQGRDLEQALEYAEAALRLARAEAQASGWTRLFRGFELRTRESIFLNTRGWLHFLLGSYEPAMRDLTRAVELSPLGANFLYLALAHDGLGHDREAREAARQALAVGGLMPEEERQLAELMESLGVH